MQSSMATSIAPNPFRETWSKYLSSSCTAHSLLLPCHCQNGAWRSNWVRAVRRRQKLPVANVVLSLAVEEFSTQIRRCSRHALTVPHAPLWCHQPSAVYGQISSNSYVSVEGVGAICIDPRRMCLFKALVTVSLTQLSWQLCSINQGNTHNMHSSKKY